MTRGKPRASIRRRASWISPVDAWIAIRVEKKMINTIGHLSQMLVSSVIIETKYL
jgi:hypothetical protein